MFRTIGIILATVAVFFDFMSYIKQIQKTLHTKHSKDVSTRAYLMKITHYICSTISLAIFCNWVGFSMELAAFVICLITFAVIAHFKPRGWKLFS